MVEVFPTTYKKDLVPHKMFHGQITNPVILYGHLTWAMLDEDQQALDISGDACRRPVCDGG